MATRYSLILTAGPDRKRQALLKFTERSKFMNGLLNLVSAIGCGAVSMGSGTSIPGVFDLQLDDGTNGAAGTPPQQTVTYAAPSGAQTITVGGKQISFTSTGVAASDAALAAATINADPILGVGCVATSAAAVCTIKIKVHARCYGMMNGITCAATGTGATANGATFTGGVSAQANGFSL